KEHFTINSEFHYQIFRFTLNDDPKIKCLVFFSYHFEIVTEIANEEIYQRSLKISQNFKITESFLNELINTANDSKKYFFNPSLLVRLIREKKELEVAHKLWKKLLNGSYCWFVRHYLTNLLIEISIHNKNNFISELSESFTDNNDFKIKLIETLIEIAPTNPKIILDFHYELIKDDDDFCYDI